VIFAALIAGSISGTISLSIAVSRWVNPVLTLMLF
tara:strand:- start:99771 stop:99875 length:105 start_codon:yes stop_codon:yes gene_type:complete